MRKIGTLVFKMVSCQWIGRPNTVREAHEIALKLATAIIMH